MQSSLVSDAVRFVSVYQTVDLNGITQVLKIRHVLKCLAKLGPSLMHVQHSLVETNKTILLITCNSRSESFFQKLLSLTAV